MLSAFLISQISQYRIHFILIRYSFLIDYLMISRFDQNSYKNIDSS